MSSQHRIRSILFVCLGNICRSPAGENVMRRQLDNVGLADEVRCDSAGTGGYHIGAPPDTRMRIAGQKRGLPMTGSARKLTPADLDAFDLILAMDDENYRDLISLATENNRQKIKRFSSYFSRYSATEVPDPYEGSSKDFEHVLDLLEDGCAQILREIQRHA